MFVARVILSLSVDLFADINRIFLVIFIYIKVVGLYLILI